MTTSTLAPLADAAVSARTGADLYRFGLADRIPDHAFASNSDGSVTISGIDFLKSGTFNGLGLVDADLVAMVDHFTSLRDSGIFLPPFRLDHSWSVLSVIGWIENLETYRRVDSTDSMEKTFLRGDVRVTGSVDYTPAQLVKAIKGGSLRNRSSELGYYVTNSGVELPLVFYGCAFVDIPAVEGLAPVSLSKVRLSTPRSLVNLTAEGTPTMDPENPTSDDQVDDGEGVVAPAPEASDDAAGVEPAEDAGVAPEEETEEEGDLEEEPAAEDDDQVEESSEEEEPEVEPDQEPEEEEPAGDDEVAQLRRENARLRREAANREIARFREAGSIVAANEEAATTLLTHDDEDVRRMAGTLLANVPSTVALGRRQGRTNLSSDGNAGGNASGRLIELGMTKDEVGPLWASLTTAERRARQSEYDEWRKDREENGIRD